MPELCTKQDNVGVTNEAQPQPQYTAQPQVVDNGGFGWGLLGCCIPIVGLVLFLVWKDNKLTQQRLPVLVLLLV